MKLSKLQVTVLFMVAVLMIKNAYDAAGAADNGSRPMRELISLEASYLTSSDYNRDYIPLPALLTGKGVLHKANLPGGNDPAPEFAFHTALEDDPYIIIDLGRMFTVSGLRIENRRRQFMERARDLTIWLSDDRFDWNMKAQLSEVKPVWEVDFPETSEARYIKLGLQRRDYLHLARVEVFGSPEVVDGDWFTGRTTPAGPMRMQIKPSDFSQRFKFPGGLAVEIPAGTVSDPAELEVAPLLELPPGSGGDFEAIAAYEIRLGPYHEFEQPLRLELPYPLERFDSLDHALRDIVAARYDESADAWIALPLDIDLDFFTLQTETRHLSWFGWFFRIKSWAYREMIAEQIYSVLRTRYFKMYFEEASLEGLARIQKWTSQAPRPVYFSEFESAGSAQYKRGGDQVDLRRVFVRSPRAEILPFIDTMLWYLNSSFASYEKSGFPVPLNRLPVSIHLTTGRSRDVPANYCTETGNLNLRADPTNQWDSTHEGFLHTIAHEVFHAFQGAMIDYSTQKMTDRSALWWIESTAEYASCNLVQGFDLTGAKTAALPDIKTQIGGSGTYSVWPYLAEYPLVYAGHAREFRKDDTQGNDLEYDRGWLLHYLLAKVKKPFPKVFKTVQQEYGKAGSPLPAFRKMCQDLGLPLPVLQREFAAWFILGKTSPLARIPPNQDTRPNNGVTGIPLLSVVNENNGRPDVCKPGPGGSIRRVFRLAECYTSQAWAVKPARPANPKPVTLEVKVESIPAAASVDIYTCTGNKRLPGLPPRSAGHLNQTGQKARVTLGFGIHDDLEVGVNNAPVKCDDVLYIIVTNADEQRQAEVAVRVSQIESTPAGKPPVTPGNPPNTPAAPGTASGVAGMFHWAFIDTKTYQSQDYNLADYSKQSGSAAEGVLRSQEEWTLGETTGRHSGVMSWKYDTNTDRLVPGTMLKATVQITDETGQGEVKGWIAFQGPETGWQMYDSGYQPIADITAGQGSEPPNTGQKVPAGRKEGDLLLLRARLNAGRSSITFDRIYRWQRDE